MTSRSGKTLVWPLVSGVEREEVSSPQHIYSHGNGDSGRERDQELIQANHERWKKSSVQDGGHPTARAGKSMRFWGEV